MEPNTTKARIHQSKEMYYNTKKLKPGLVASYDIWNGKGEGLFLFEHFKNLSLTYLLRQPPNYSPRTHKRPTVHEHDSYARDTIIHNLLISTSTMTLGMQASIFGACRKPG